MLTKTCVECKQQFEVEPAKSWATRCLPCWLAQQDRQGKRKVESLQAEVDYWRERAQGGETKLDAQVVENMRLRFELNAARSQPTGGNSLPADWRDQLPRLIQLCHPDRHSGSVAAHRATCWLLGMKQRPRQSG